MIALRSPTTLLPGLARAPVLRLCGVTKSFGRAPYELRVLEQIDLDIDAGTLTLIMGPSGSGKTTLLTIAGLLLRPTTGSVSVGGIDVTDLSEAELPAIRRREVSFVFQAFNLLSALSASENVQIGLELQGLRGRQARGQAIELLDRVGLLDRADHLPAELSGGEKQRVGVARALASPARLILADEPTGNLDRRTSQRIVELLRNLAHEEDRSVVVVTHDPRLESFADRIVRIEDGRIVADE